jgi:hypothetical protein
MTSIKIFAPICFSKEIEYTLSFIFDNKDYDIFYNFSENHKNIILDFGRFKLESSIDFFEDYYKYRRSFTANIKKLNVIEYGLNCEFEDDFLPIFFGNEIIELSNTRAILNFDFFGTIFFFLSGYDELFISNRDSHGRVSAFDTTIYKSGCVQRPIVDEYIFFLFTILNKIGIISDKISRVGKVIYTCDVDYPFDESINSFKRFFYEIVKDVFIRVNFILLLKRFVNVFLYHLNIHLLDPYYSFQRILEICKKYHCDMEFFFIVDNYQNPINGNYQLDNKVAKIIRRVLSFGGRIGVHGSYNSYKSLDLILSEKSKFELFLKSQNINFKISSIRQHYLQIDYSCTMPLFIKAGYVSDFTGGFADYPGFRFGTSKPFYMWDHSNLSKTTLLQRPLILMEATLFAKRYLNLNYDKKVLNEVLKLKINCLKYGGDFIFLWHNSHFNSKKDFDFFENILSN